VSEAALALEAAYVTLLGLLLGSFMNVCIYRLPRGLSPVRPRSGCPKCGHMLAWFENVPIVSYLVLRGRCRMCRTPISPMYPIVEGITGAVFLAGYLWYGPEMPLLLVSRLTFAWALIALFIIDFEHQILPNVITLPGIVVGILFNLLGAGPGWVDSIIGAAAGAGGLYLIAEIYYRVRHEEGLGMGDVKMLGMIGAFLGWKPMVLTLVFAGVAFALAVIGIYGVLAWGVAQRIGEIGVRMALGARAADIGRMILGQGGRLIAIGFVLGTLGAVALGRVLSAQLFGVDAFDPAVLAITLLGLGAAAFVASWLPARRASRVDPMSALREE